jgi:heme/copper-type cytochrome/quinol oxidase subunit 1
MDFPDAYAGWNYVSSFGSIISLVAVFIFMYIIYRTFTDNITVNANYWYSPEMFEIDTDAERIYSLEWTQNSPPTFHTYEELPYMVSTK